MATEQGRICYFADGVIEETGLPPLFTFPFCYEPHPLAKAAAADLQQYLTAQKDFDHNFGLAGNEDGTATGKMFGVLVVADANGRIGYLSAFSGKLAGSNGHARFVPPVFDMLKEQSFFLKGQQVIDAVNAAVDEIRSDENYIRLKSDFEEISIRSSEEISALKEELKRNKIARDLQRQQYIQGDTASDAAREAALVSQSRHDKSRLKLLTKEWKTLLANTSSRLALYEARIEALSNERRARSAALQEELFDQYTFLNQEGERKSLRDIFSQTAFGKPPSGAGECATPKLLQFAFLNKYHPLAMAEFWWGATPGSEVREHGQFYPACSGKCKPILAHMLLGIPVDTDPMMQRTNELTRLETVYEDEWLIVVNKPAGLLSVPGINVYDSVYCRLRAAMKGIEPLMVHRLDMDTSGLLVVAKTQEVHKHIQKQFLHRIVAKRYTALLSRPLDNTSGEIRLPLCADVYNRPRQMVCHSTGKKSVTRWKTVEKTSTTTKVHFWPQTGRTHQLRVHAAHGQGLNAPIVGDELYGTAAGRLHLHAENISFIHPITNERVSFEVAEDF